MFLLPPSAHRPDRRRRGVLAALVALAGVAAATPAAGPARDLLRYGVAVSPDREEVSIRFSAKAVAHPAAVVAALPGRDFRSLGQGRLAAAFHTGVVVPLAPAGTGWSLDLPIPAVESVTSIVVWFVALDSSGRPRIAPGLPLVVLPNDPSPAASSPTAATGTAGAGAGPGGKPNGGGSGVPAASAGRSGGTLLLRALANDASITIHDQPTPVQGSGH